MRNVDRRRVIGRFRRRSHVVRFGFRLFVLLWLFGLDRGFFAGTSGFLFGTLVSLSL